MGSNHHQTCACGEVRLSIDRPSRRVGTRMACYCKDCQTAAHALGAEALLLPGGGTDIWQTTPDRLQIEAGARHLTILRLSPRGLFRWYAACCNTPLFNTLPNLRLPFVGIIQPDHEVAERHYGPPRATVFTSHAGLGGPRTDKNANGAGWGIVSRMITATLSGRAHQSALRDPGGAPIAPIRVLTLDERKAARPES